MIGGMFKNAFSLFVLAAVATAPAFGLEWMTDFAAAKAKAKAEKKAVLMDFTGSDWCGWCIRLRKEVLDKPEFEAYAKDKFVFLEVDCPRNKKQAPKLAAQNNKLCNQYHVSGFPTLLVVSAKGEVLGGTGGYRDMDGMKAMLEAALANRKAIAKANKLPEAERQDALDIIYAEMEPAARQATGNTERIEKKIAEQKEQFKQKIEACTDLQQMVNVADECLKVSLPANRRYLLDRKFTAMVNGAETVEDLAAARKVAEELMGVLPTAYAEHIKEQIDRDFADPAAFLQHLKEQRSQMQQQ